MLSGDERSSGSQVTMADEAGEGAQSDLLGELARLREEHRDLDSAIEALERSVAGDQLQIQRLKKRKLTLRDRIYHIEDALTPDRLVAFAKGAVAAGLKVVIAGAGGAAHLPGMAAAMTRLPVFGVPVESKALSGQDRLLSIVQMPAGIPVGTLAIGRAGAVNAALLAAAVLARTDPDLAERLEAWRAAQSASVAERPVTEENA